MLCGLADGLDAVRRHGVTANRALLIGGAARSPAVSRIAAEVFDIGVEVPEPGEYVALGAAVQAAWAHTGSRPDWTVSSLAHPRATVPDIREQYAQRRQSPQD
jgi:xylulokinase